MLVSAPQLGFSITSPFKAVAHVATAAGRTVYSVARDPNVQAAAVSAAQQTAPGQYARVTQQAAEYTARARAIQAALRPGMPAPMMVPAPGGDDDMGPGPAMIKPQHGLTTLLALVGAGILIYVVATR